MIKLHKQGYAAWSYCLAGKWCGQVVLHQFPHLTAEHMPLGIASALLNIPLWRCPWSSRIEWLPTCVPQHSFSDSAFTALQGVDWEHPNRCPMEEWMTEAFGPRVRKMYVFFIYIMYILWQRGGKLCISVWDSRTAFSPESVTKYIWDLESGIQYSWTFVS